MAKRWAAQFKNLDGTLATGLTGGSAPTGSVNGVAAGADLVGVAMTELGLGWYYVDQPNYDPTDDWAGNAEAATLPLTVRNVGMVDIVPTVDRDGVRVDRASAIDIVDEAHFSAAYDDTSTTEVLRLKAWLTRGALPVVPTAITITILNQNGTTLASFTDADPEVTGPNADNAFLLVTDPNDVLLLDEQAYSVLLSITDAEGTVTTQRGMPTF